MRDPACRANRGLQRGDRGWDTDEDQGGQLAPPAGFPLNNRLLGRTRLTLSLIYLLSDNIRRRRGRRLGGQVLDGRSHAFIEDDVAADLHVVVVERRSSVSPA